LINSCSFHVFNVFISHTRYNEAICYVLKQNITSVLRHTHARTHTDICY